MTRFILGFIAGFVAAVLAIRGLPHDEEPLPNYDWPGW